MAYPEQFVDVVGKGRSRANRYVALVSMTHEDGNGVERTVYKGTYVGTSSGSRDGARGHDGETRSRRRTHHPRREVWGVGGSGHISIRPVLACLVES